MTTQTIRTMPANLGNKLVESYGVTVGFQPLVALCLWQICTAQKKGQYLAFAFWVGQANAPDCV